MTEVLSPGVYVEETSFRSKSIESVGTSVAAIVGPTRRGPLRGKPEVLTSFDEFRRVYGDASDLEFGGVKTLNHTALAARAFFDNGGRKLFVVRVASASSAIAAVGQPASLTFRSRFPGNGGNFVLELLWRDSANVLRSFTPRAPAVGDTVAVTGEAPAAAFEPPLAPASLAAGESVRFAAVAVAQAAPAGQVGVRLKVTRAAARKTTPGSPAVDITDAVLKSGEVAGLQYHSAEIGRAHV